MRISLAAPAKPTNLVPLLRVTICRQMPSCLGAQYGNSVNAQRQDGCYAGGLIRDASAGLSVPGASGVEPVVPPAMLSAIMRAVHSPQAGASAAVAKRLASRLPPLQVWQPEHEGSRSRHADARSCDFKGTGTGRLMCRSGFKPTQHLSQVMRSAAACVRDCLEAADT